MIFFASDLRYKEGIWVKKLFRKHTLILKIKGGLLSTNSTKKCFVLAVCVQKRSFCTKIRVFSFLPPLEWFFQKVTFPNFYYKFHSKTFLQKKNITKVCFQRFRRKIENFQKMSISGPDLRSKNRLAEKALYTLAFVIKLSKRC